MDHRCNGLWLVAIVFTLAACTSVTPGAAPAQGADRVTALEAFGTLFTATVDFAGAPRRLLVDNGGGMTVFTPEMAGQAGCALGGPLAGFRMSGERVDAPRCEGATVRIDGWVSRPHTVMVLDIDKLLPADWPRQDGLISLSSFAGHVVTIDMPGRRLVVDDSVPRDARSVRARFERSVAGLSLWHSSPAVTAPRTSGWKSTPAATARCPSTKRWPRALAWPPPCPLPTPASTLASTPARRFARRSRPAR